MAIKQKRSTNCHDLHARARVADVRTIVETTQSYFSHLPPSCGLKHHVITRTYIYRFVRTHLLIHLKYVSFVHDGSRSRRRGWSKIKHFDSCRVSTSLRKSFEISSNILLCLFLFCVKQVFKVPRNSLYRSLSFSKGNKSQYLPMYKSSIMARELSKL